MHAHVSDAALILLNPYFVAQEKHDVNHMAHALRLGGNCTCMVLFFLSGEKSFRSSMTRSEPVKFSLDSGRAFKLETFCAVCIATLWHAQLFLHTPAMYIFHRCLKISFSGSSNNFLCVIATVIAFTYL